MPVLTQAISVVKRNVAGEEILNYSGTRLHQDAQIIILEAHFSLPDLPFMGTIIRTGDRFIETYFTDRWYNVFEIHDREDDRLKGWYCNVGRPAVMESENTISYVDLALDLWVAPDGSQTVLDEDEFNALDLDESTRSRARAALIELQNHFLNNKEPGLF
jgi:uncharacterized protein